VPKRTRICLNVGPNPTTNEIVCRGYAKRAAASMSFQPLLRDQAKLAKPSSQIEMGFTPSLKAAGLEGRGTKAWRMRIYDRPIGARGPFRVRFEDPGKRQLRQQLHGTPLDTSPTAAERFPDAQTIPVLPQESKSLLELLWGKAEWQLFPDDWKWVLETGCRVCATRR